MVTSRPPVAAVGWLQLSAERPWSPTAGPPGVAHARSPVGAVSALLIPLISPAERALSEAAPSGVGAGLIICFKRPKKDRVRSGAGSVGAGVGGGSAVAGACGCTLTPS